MVILVYLELVVILDLAHLDLAAYQVEVDILVYHQAAQVDIQEQVGPLEQVDIREQAALLEQADIREQAALLAQVDIQEQAAIVALRAAVATREQAGLLAQ